MTDRPRIKLHKLSVYLSPAVGLSAARDISDDQTANEYLPSMVPQSINLLQPFEFDPRFAGKSPYLPASRITKVAPAAPPQRETGRKLRSVPRRLFRAGPALFWRVRFSRNWVPPRTNWIFASLELEVTPFWPCHISIQGVQLKLAHGEVVFLGPRLPDACKPGDQFTILYKLMAPVDDGPSASNAVMTDQLDISITATANISSVCTPSVNIDWSTTADFTEQKRPPSRPPSHVAELARATGPDSLPFSGGGNLEKPATPTGPSGVTVTITGPERIVVGKPFRWEIFVVNRSESVQNLAIIPIRKLDGSWPAQKLPPTDRDVYDMPISWFFEPSELTCLSTMVRSG